MAESISDLYFRLGLDYSELKSDFVDAEKTVATNLARLNREKSLIQLRAEVALSGMDEAADSTARLRVQSKALTEQIDIQQDRVRIMTAVYEELARTQGENAVGTLNFAIQLEKERLALGRLEQQTRELSRQQEIAFGVNFELLGLIDPAIKGISSLEAAGRTLPIPHAKAAAAIALVLSSIIVGSKEATDELQKENPAKVLGREFAIAERDIRDSLDSVAEQTAETFETVNQSIQHSAERTTRSIHEATYSYIDYLSDFFRVAAIATSETNSIEEALKSVTAQIQYIKSDSAKLSGMTIGTVKVIKAVADDLIDFSRPAIENYRELKQVADELNLPLETTNDLLTKIKLAGANLNDVRDYVRGAQDAVIKGDSEDPEVIAFAKYGVVIQDTMGKLIPFDQALERIYQGYLKASEAGEAEAYVMMTNGQAVQDVLPFFKRLAQAQKDLETINWASMDTVALAEASRDLKLLEIQRGEFKTALSSLAVPAADMALKETFNLFNTGTKFIEDNRFEILRWSFVLMEAVRSVKGAIGNSALDKLSAVKDMIVGLNDTFGVTDKISGLVKFLTGGNDDDNIFTRASKDVEDYIRANEAARNSAEKTAEEITAGLSYSYNRIAKYKAELSAITIDLNYGDNDYQKSLANLSNWRQSAMKDARYYAEEQIAIEKLYNAKRVQIEQERADRIAEIREGIESTDRPDFTNTIIQIEKERQSWVKAGMNIAESIELSQKRTNQAYRERNRAIAEIRDSVESLGRTELENRFAQIDKDVQNWRNAGMDESESLVLAEKLKLDAIQTLNASFSAQLNSLRQTDLEKQLANIDRERKEWIAKGIDEARATEMAEQSKAKIIVDFNQTVVADLNSIWQSELDNRIAQIEREKQAWIRKGVDEVKATKWAEQAKVDAQRNAAMSVLKSQLDAYHVYQKGGYKGLLDYQRGELFKSGITPKDLQITPQQLADFQKARETAERSLLPNFMSDYDKFNAESQRRLDVEDILSRIEINGKRLELNSDLERMFGLIPIDSLNKLGEVSQTATNELSALSPQIDDASNRLTNFSAVEQPETPIDASNTISAFENLPASVDEVVNSFAALSPQIDDVTSKLINLSAVEQPEATIDASNTISAFENLPASVNKVVDSFAALFPWIDDVTSKIADFEMIIPQIDTSEIIAEFEDLVEPMNEVNLHFSEMSERLINAIDTLTGLSQTLDRFSAPQINSQHMENSTPPSITANVQIEEAHAWDSRHIQELADKVADAIVHELVSAIGGDSNRY